MLRVRAAIGIRLDGAVPVMHDKL